VAFRRGLREGGFVEGQNATIEYRWGLGERERLAELASDLVGKPVSVLYYAHDQDEQHDDDPAEEQFRKSSSPAVALLKPGSSLLVTVVMYPSKSV
jgi:hypothetical protein